MNKAAQIRSAVSQAASMFGHAIFVVPNQHNDLIVVRLFVFKNLDEIVDRAMQKPR